MLAPLLALLHGAAAQGGHGGAGPEENLKTAPTVTSTTYVSAPTAAEPPINQGPWTDKDHLEGTWSSKSMMVMTGPDFYDPVDELFIEPALPGISFSFTKDGYFEQAEYQITPDPRNNSCSTAALTFQHGRYNISNGKMTMTPFEDDGRQLVSEPCKQNYSQYVFYEQEITLKEFFVAVDLYYGRYRLNLYEFDGTPRPPLYLVYRPPQMLPTSTLNPGVKEEVKEHNSSSKREVMPPVRERIRRSLINRSRTSAQREVPISPLYNAVWWGGVSMIFVGAAGWLYLA